MRILELKDIEKKDMLIHYRRVYDANAVIEMIDKSMCNLAISITIEQSPMGHNDVSLDIHGDLDYPLVPALKKLKTFVMESDEQGILP